MKGSKRIGGHRDSVRLDVVGADRREESTVEPAAQEPAVPADSVDALSEADDRNLWPSPGVPLKVAQKVVEQLYSNEIGVSTLRYWRGSFWKWSGTCWAEVEDTAIRRDLYGCFEKAHYLNDKDKVAPWTPNSGNISGVILPLKSLCLTPIALEPPCWLWGPGRPPAAELVAMSNGLVHVPTRTLHDHDARMFNLIALRFAFDPAAPQPTRWHAFLDELWPNDPEAVVALQEWFGYVVSGRTDLHKILLLIGPTRAGKGVICHVLSALIGRDNVAGPTLSSFNNNFGLQPLIGKSLAIIADTRLGRVTHQIVERLLSTSGEDSLTIDRKYKDPWTGKLTTRLIIASNELPHFDDASGALAGRMILLRLTRSFRGHENPALRDELVPELPGILNWALEGLDRINATGRISESKNSSDLMLTLEELLSPIAAFVRDECETGPQYEVEVGVLYNAWRDWCKEHGREPGTSQQFGSDLHAAVSEVTTGQRRRDNSRVRVYQGLRHRPRGPWD